MTNLANEQALAQQPTPIPETVIQILRRPLPPEAIKPHPTKKFLSTIKAIYAVERLNEAFGLNGWKIKNELVELYETKNEETGKVRTMVVMKSFLTVPAYGIEIEAYGGNDNEDRGDAYKGACTDALTKICSYIYVGMDVYKGIKSAPLVNAAGELTGGSQKSADDIATGKLIAMAQGVKAKDVMDVLHDVTVAIPPDEPEKPKSKAFLNLMKSFEDILGKFQKLYLEDIYYDHLKAAKVRSADQFTDDEKGFNAARKCFRGMLEALPEVEMAKEK